MHWIDRAIWTVVIIALLMFVFGVALTVYEGVRTVQGKDCGDYTQSEYKTGDVPVRCKEDK